MRTYAQKHEEATEISWTHNEEEMLGEFVTHIARQWTEKGSWLTNCRIFVNGKRNRSRKFGKGPSLLRDRIHV